MFGAWAAEERAEQEAAAMLHALERRGPDGAAAHLDARREILLGMRLLKVTTDEPEAAVLANEDESLLMVCDGHVFNREELTEWLRGKGHTLRSGHSCELLLHLFEEEGPDGWRRADGQFALAIWDRNRQRLVLGRDFLGVRPLYYHATPRGILFASEIKALLRHSRGHASGASAAIDEIGVSHYLTFLTVPGPRTLFAGIAKLDAGSAAVCEPNGKVEVRPFWDLLQDPIPEVEDERFYVERVRELHHRAVRHRQVEGPIGALVSGGNDSSANAVLMARNGCQPLHTFTVALADLEGQQKYSDTIYARQVAELIESHHHELMLSAGEFVETLPIIVEAMDDMVSEPSSVFLYHALRAAKEAGVRVVVTGEANDELCCGHGEMIRLRNNYYERWLPFTRKPGWARRAAAAVAPHVSPGRVDILRRAASGDEYFWNFEIAWQESQKPEILAADAWERCRGESPATVVARYADRVRASEHGQRDYLNYMIYVMMQDYYFGNHMLGKLDLLSAPLGLESRCPYTEPAYAHFVYNVPATLKFRGETVKYFFKKAIEGVLPNEIIYRPKQGFRTPVVELFQGRLGDWATPVLLEQGLTRTGFLRRDHLERLLSSHRDGSGEYSSRLWTAMALNMWHERWIQRAAPAAKLPPLKRTQERDGVLTLR
jgi:asparagine synthase (glutamine-hydrolysing)